MKTGHNLPYQLRSNKAVERLVFVDLLSRLDKELHISSEYDYYGFGGPQMEDFRLVHEGFPLMKMVSVERDVQVQKRQKYNKPHTNIQYKLKSSADFINNFSFKRKAIVWLDYTSPKERVGQITEFQTILRKVQDCSIIKITLNAAAATLGNNDNQLGIQAKRRDNFMDDFERCFPKGLQEENVSTKNFPSTLLQVLEYSAAESLQGRSDYRFQPLSSSTYADGQTMLTVTGLVGERKAIRDLLKKSGLKEWQYYRPEWDHPIWIDVPELTLKERIHINELLPKCEGNIEAIHRKIGFFLGDSEEDSKQKLEQYILFYKHYPYFNKINI